MTKEIMALKAVVEPMFINARSKLMAVERPIE
jgi:hypothetical protein